MPRSFLSQELQVDASASYDDAVASVHTVGVAEGQTHLEGDLNVLRSLLKSDLGLTNWYDQPDMTLNAVANKYFIAELAPSGFTTGTAITATGSTTLFDSAIKTITNHNDGGGNSTTEGVIVNGTKAYRVEVRDHSTQDPFDDGSGNEVYGRLTFDTTPAETGDSGNLLSGYSNITGIVSGVNTDSENKLYFTVVDDGGGNYHVNIYKDSGTTQLVGHTASYSGTGAQTVVADNSSGLGGTITVDTLGAGSGIVVTFGTYTITWYSWQTGSEVPYTFSTTPTVDIGYVAVSRPYETLDWDIFMHNGWHDVTGPLGTITDDNVTVDGMLYLYNGLTTQAQVNAKGDKLGHADTDGEGAELVAIDDTATGSNGYYTGSDVQAALTELKTQIGGTTSTTYTFTENNVIPNDTYIYPALDLLDKKWGDLASTATGEGASLVGVEDAGGYYTGTDVEAVLQEIGQLIADVSGWDKGVETTAAPITSGATHDITHAYTLGSGAHLDVYVDGQLMTEGAANDYQEVSGSGGAGGVGQISFGFTVPTGKNLTYMVRK